MAETFIRDVATGRISRYELVRCKEIDGLTCVAGRYSHGSDWHVILPCESSREAERLATLIDGGTWKQSGDTLSDDSDLPRRHGGNE